MQVEKIIVLLAGSDDHINQKILGEVSRKLYIVDDVSSAIEGIFWLVRANELAACTRYEERKKLRTSGKTFCFCLMEVKGQIDQARRLVQNQDDLWYSIIETLIWRKDFHVKRHDGYTGIRRYEIGHYNTMNTMRCMKLIVEAIDCLMCMSRSAIEWNLLSHSETHENKAHLPWTFAIRSSYGSSSIVSAPPICARGYTG